MKIIRPPGAGAAPRFRPVNTRRRVVAVSIVLGLCTTVGAAAWTFGVQSPASSRPPCEFQAYQAPVPDRVRVNVFNSTLQGGLAAQVAGALKERGFVVGEIANDPLRRDIRGTGELRYGPGAETTNLILALRSWQPGMVLVKDSRRNGPEVDFVLGQKFERLNEVPEPPPGVKPPGCAPIDGSSAR